MAIKGISDRALRRFLQRGDGRRLPPYHVARIGEILEALDGPNPLRALSAPTYRLHRLKGDRNDEWSVRVGGGWCVTFRTDGTNGWITEYDNCHRGHT